MRMLYGTAAWILTNLLSGVQDSCQKGWRLFSIIAAYFTCSPLLKPYLFKYLESSAYDKRRAYHGTALVSTTTLINSVQLTHFCWVICLFIVLVKYKCCKISTKLEDK